MRNLVVRNPGTHEKIYAQCENCKQLVARYILAEMGYYHHGKGVESFLKSVENSGDMYSGRDLLETFKNISEDENKNFEKIATTLHEMGKDD